MTRKWKTDDEHGDSLAEMDELPTHEYVSPPAAPPRRRRNNYQVKVSGWKCGESGSCEWGSNGEVFGKVQRILM